MIYMQSVGGTKILVLESANLDELRQGRPIVSEDKSVVIAWTPDMVWLADKIMDTSGDAKEIGRLIDEAAKRPEKSGPRPAHGAHLHKFDKPGTSP